MNNRKLVAILACRSNGRRLYGKPLQYLDPTNDLSILEYIIKSLRYIIEIKEIALAISEGVDNYPYILIAKKFELRWIIGSEINVLNRLVECGKQCKATDILRITTESPFPYLPFVPYAWNLHIRNNNDATFLDEIVDGCGFEIISLKALETSHLSGSDRHRSEFCSLFIRENPCQFKISKLLPKNELIRKDLRLTVDYPEDLIVCRRAYEYCKSNSLSISLEEIIKFLDKTPELKDLIKPYTELGYSTMYI